MCLCRKSSRGVGFFRANKGLYRSREMSRVLLVVFRYLFLSCIFRQLALSRRSLFGLQFSHELLSECQPSRYSSWLIYLFRKSSTQSVHTIRKTIHQNFPIGFRISDSMRNFLRLRFLYTERKFVFDVVLYANKHAIKANVNLLWNIEPISKFRT